VVYVDVHFDVLPFLLFERNFYATRRTIRQPVTGVESEHAGDYNDLITELSTGLGLTV
jgi:hypothetical protein